MALSCASDPPPPPPPPPAPPPTVAPPPTAPPAETAKAPELTPEEKKEQEALKELEKDRAKMKADHEKEKGRWTADLKTEAQKLAAKDFASGKDAIKATASAKTRKPENAARDKYRHPVETLDFFGFKPTMTVLEYSPGEGWYTELLAPALAKKGKLLATNTDPNGPADERSTFYGERFKSFLETSPELYGKVETVLLAPKTQDVGHENGVDMVLVMRALHGMVNNKSLDGWLATFHKSLRGNGILGIEEPRAPEGTNPEEMAKKGYLPEKWVIEKIEAAGFQLQGKSEINANKADTKDYPDGVWDLPPTLRKGDTDKEKYLAIGESDRMTLKFVKVAPKKDGDKSPMTKDAAPKPADKK